MTQAPPMYWLKQLESDLEECKAIPLWGHAPDFPWEMLQNHLREKLGVEDFTLTPMPADSTAEDLLAPFGLAPRKLFFQLSPLSETLLFVLSKESMSKITSLILQQGQEEKSFTEDFQEGYYQFLLLQICKEIENLAIYPSLHIQWAEEQQIEKNSFFLDIAITLYGKQFPSRLIIPPHFQHSFSAHFMGKQFDLKEAAHKRDVTAELRVHAGSCQITKSEWSSLAVGDCLVLDRCSYNPETQKGTAEITWNTDPLFRVKIKKNQLKILDYAVYQGEKDTMLDQFSDDAFNEEGEDLQTEIENLQPPEDEVEPMPEESQEPEASAPQEEGFEEPPQESLEAAPEEAVLRVEEVPFSVVVEIDRVKISLEKLLQLQPGNVLELPTRPEQGVSLTVHGKSVARGELIKIGDLLGVKIVEINQ